MPDNKFEKTMQNEKSSNSKWHRTLTVIGIILCIILTPPLIVNCTLIVKSYVNKTEVPAFGGYMPLIVLTDSMYPEIEAGDLIFCRTAKADQIQEGDVISFFDPAGNGTSVTTHKVVEIVESNGSRSFRTRGINNNTDDRILVPAESLVGVYTDFRIPGAGNFALFMQTVPGLIVCVIVPLFLLVGYDLIRRRLYEKSTGNDVAALKAELEALRAEKAAATASETTLESSDSGEGSV
jgi:signal peptidase